MNTTEKISTVTLDMIRARLGQSDQRTLAAAGDMSERFHRRGPAPVCPDDLPSPELPAVAAVPDAVQSILTEIDFWSTGERRPQQMTAVCRKSIFPTGSAVLSSASPTQMVAAIRSADEYATQMEQKAAAYRETVAAAVAAHTSSHADAARELVGLCGQV